MDKDKDKEKLKWIVENSMNGDNVKKAEKLFLKSNDDLKDQFFDDVITMDVLYDMDKIPEPIRQHIKATDTEEGSNRALFQLITQVFNYDNAFKQLLILLIDKNQANFVKKVLEKIKVCLTPQQVTKE